MDRIYDVVIIGAGPAGLSAAIYAERARLSTLMLETAYISGGQILNTYEVDNYPGLPGVSGMDLGMKMQEHAEKLGLKTTHATVQEISLAEQGNIKVIHTDQGDYRTRAVIIATGARHSHLNVPGEERLTGAGVSYCATCDGAFFRDKTVAVVGGGNVAVEDAIFLARVCKQVYVVHRRDELRAVRLLQDNLLALNNVEMKWDSIVTEISGEQKVERLTLLNVKDQQTSECVVDGVFIAVGIEPNSEAFKTLIKADEKGYLVADESGVTNIPGIFVAGDVRTKELRQIITAAADGANVITSVQRYLLA